MQDLPKRALPFCGCCCCSSLVCESIPKLQLRDSNRRRIEEKKNNHKKEKRKKRVRLIDWSACLMHTSPLIGAFGCNFHTTMSSMPQHTHSQPKQQPHSMEMRCDWEVAFYHLRPCAHVNLTYHFTEMIIYCFYLECTVTCLTRCFYHGYRGRNSWNSICSLALRQQQLRQALAKQISIQIYCILFGFRAYLIWHKTKLLREGYVYIWKICGSTIEKCTFIVRLKFRIDHEQIQSN